MTKLIIIVEPSCSNLWKKMQRTTTKYPAELWTSVDERERRDYMRKGVNIMKGVPQKQLTRTCRNSRPVEHWVFNGIFFINFWVFSHNLLRESHIVYISSAIFRVLVLFHLLLCHFCSLLYRVLIVCLLLQLEFWSLFLHGVHKSVGCHYSTSEINFFYNILWPPKWIESIYETQGKLYLLILHCSLPRRLWVRMKKILHVCLWIVFQ